VVELSEVLVLSEVVVVPVVVVVALSENSSFSSLQEIMLRLMNEIKMINVNLFIIFMVLVKPNCVK
jgi:hypothetical protein